MTGPDHRFFVEPGCIRGDSVTIGPERAHQLSHVLRLRPGDCITVLDNAGWEYTVRLTALSPDAAEGAVQERRPAQGEPLAQITLYQGLLKGDKLEYVLQKGTEVGIAAFVPVLCQRSVARLSAGPEKMARWRHIIREAAEQSRRGRLPELAEAVSFQKALESAQGLVLAPWEQERALGLRAALSRNPAARHVSLFIGPEGGFTEAEASAAAQEGAILVSLGRRILRAETAGVVAAAAILFHYGELGG